MNSSETKTLPWEQVGPEHKRNIKRAGMLLDLDRCVGCHSCSVSCKTEHDVPLGGFRMRVRYLERPEDKKIACLLYTSPSPRDQRGSRMPSSA